MRLKFLILAFLPIMLLGQNIRQIRTYDSTLFVTDQGFPDDTLWKFTSDYLIRYVSNVPTDTLGTGSGGGSTDSLYHDDTEVWLSNGDTIPKADSVRSTFTATDTLISESIKIGSSGDTTTIDADGTIHQYSSGVEVLRTTSGGNVESANIFQSGLTAGNTNTLLNSSINTTINFFPRMVLNPGATAANDSYLFDRENTATTGSLFEFRNNGTTYYDGRIDSLIADLVDAKFRSLITELLNTDTIISGADTATGFIKIEEVTFDSLKTKQLRITDSTLIVEDLPERPEEYQVYYNETTGKLSYAEVVHSYGAFADSSITINLAVQGTYYQVSGGDSTFRVLEEEGITWLTADTIQLTYTGHHKFDVGLVGIGDAGEVFRMRMYNVTQAEEIPIRHTMTGDGAGDDISMVGTSYCINCNANDKIIMELTDDSGTDPNFEVIDAYVFVEMMHRE